jgi:cyclopropane-fatty-acyl-phospholipid synthase
MRRQHSERADRLGADTDGLPLRRPSTVQLPPLPALIASLGVPGEVEFPDGRVLPTGDGDPAFRVTFRSPGALYTSLTGLAVGRAYVDKEIEVCGDFGALLDLRTGLRSGVDLTQKLRFAFHFLRSTTSMNARAINQHYSLGDDFYLSFIDRRYRFYSHGIFQSDDESLEEASEHKLESMFTSLGLEPGMRLLDIGAGWGGVTEYCGARGVHVTSVTLSEDSGRYIRRLIDEKGLPGEVFVEDFLDHRPIEPYDHAVIYGVIEHLPNYRRFAVAAWDVLRPGGRLYLDASAAVEKYTMSAFAREYIWRGTHCFLSVQDIIQELLIHGFELVDLRRETHDYELTIQGWAQRLDAARDKIIAGWGEQTYRAFRLFLWGGAHAFRTNRLQAYHLVAQRRADRGPRLGLTRRLAQVVGSLR